MLRLIFMGSDPIALPTLEWLSGEGGQFGQVAAVYTQPDRPAGRGQQVQPNAIKQWALAHQLPVHQPAKLDATDLATLRGYGADMALVMAYGHILRQEYIDSPRLGTLNLHASILPALRGASPIQSAIASGASETGVSLMRIVRALDAGPVADLERVSVGPHDTATEIENKLAQACVPLLRRNLPALAEGRLGFVEQNHVAATYCRRLDKSDGVIDFTQNAALLAARINGLMPWPGCRVSVMGQSVKLGLADCPASTANNGSSANESVPGAVLGADAEGLLVSTGGGVLRLRKLQRPGGKMLPARDFLRGFAIPVGTLLPSTTMPQLVGSGPFPYKRA